MPDAVEFPPNFKDTVEDTRDLVNALIDRMAAVAGNAGKRWIDGFERADVEAVAEDIGAKLKDQIMDAWSTAEKNVKPSADGVN